MFSHYRLTPVTAGFCFAIASAALFAIRPILVKLVYIEGVDPATLQLLRMAFSAPLYLCGLLFFLRRTPSGTSFNASMLLKISVIGILGYYLASYLDLLGLQHVTAQLGRMILYVYPTFVAVAGALWFREAITTRTVFALLITYAGVALIFGHDLRTIGSEVWTGGVFILGSAACFAAYLLMAKPFLMQLGSGLFTSIALLAASAAMFVHYGLLVPEPLAALGEVSARAYGLTLLIAVFCTVLPTFFTAAAVVRIGADRTSISATIGPAFTSVFAVLILSESYTVFHFVGTLMILFGVAQLDRR